MAQTRHQSTPELNRAVLMAAVAEAVFFAGAMAVWSTTHKIVWVYAVLGAGMVAFLVIFLPAFMKANAKAIEQSGQAPIVEVPHGRP